MFKRSRRKIVASIMLVLTLLFLGTLTVIYVTSYAEMRYENYEMLERQAQTYVLRMDGFTPTPGDFGPSAVDKKPSFQLSTFYSVAIGNDGRILSTDVGDRRLYDEATLQNYAVNILKSGNARGVKGNLLYLTSAKEGFTLVVFMDNTVVQERMTLLMRNTLIFGSVAMVGLFFLSIGLAKRIVDPLEESYRKQKQFISDAGHELKTPISVVGANAEILGRALGENQWLDNIRYENERMGNLVKQLLDLARTENVALVTECTDLSRLVAGEILPFESVAFEKGLTLQADITPELYVDGDGEKLKQLVSILVDNAIEHGMDGTEVTVSLHAEHGAAKLCVVNDGEPIPKHEHAHLFERFYRADEARSDSGHFGLGLAIAKAVTDAHKGKIGVNCHDGKVEFSAALPLHKA